MDLVGTFKVYFPVISGVQILIYLVILLGLGGVFLYQVRRGRMQIWQGGYLLLAFTYLYLVLLSTVYSRQPFEGKHYELVPFWSYAYAIRNRSKIMVKEIFLNVFLLMPSAAMAVQNALHTAVQHFRIFFRQPCRRRCCGGSEYDFHSLLLAQL